MASRTWTRAFATMWTRTRSSQSIRSSSFLRLINTFYETILNHFEICIFTPLKFTFMHFCMFIMLKWIHNCSLKIWKKTNRKKKMFQYREKHDQVIWNHWSFIFFKNKSVNKYRLIKELQECFLLNFFFVFFSFSIFHITSGSI